MKRSNHETVCCWICDEVAWFFQQLKKRSSYMASADAFLSKMYDGRTYGRGTIGRGKEVIWNPYLTCFLASTDYLPTLFDELQIRLGFLNRFAYVVAERKERKPLRTEPLTDEEKRDAREIEDFLKALANRTSVTTLRLSSEAKQIYNTFEEEIEKRIETEGLGITEGYCGQLPNLVVRLACLYRISRMMSEEIRRYSEPVLTVEKQDVERAMKYARKAWDWFERAIGIMQQSGTVKLRERESAKTAILEYLSDGSEKHVNGIKKFVIERTNACQATFYHALEDLREKEGKIKRTKRGFYKLKLSTARAR